MKSFSMHLGLHSERPSYDEAKQGEKLSAASTVLLNFSFAFLNEPPTLLNSLYAP